MTIDPYPYRQQPSEWADYRDSYPRYGFVFDPRYGYEQDESKYL